MTRTTPGTARGIRATSHSYDNAIGLGTDVLTADGALPIEYLTPGDRIVTFDHGLVRLEGIAPCQVPAYMALRVRPSVVDPKGTGRDFILSARQQVLVRDWRARIL